MASLLESKAHFKNRAAEIGITPATLTRLEELDISTLGSYGFSHGQPGQQIVGNDFQAWLQEQLDSEISVAETF